MGDYNRSTFECSLQELDAEMTVAINKHIEQYNLGDILSDYLICIETRNEKIKKGLFAGPGPKLMHSGIVLTPKWLLEAMKADNAPVHVHSIRLADMVVTDYEKSPFYVRIPDNGVEMTGMFTDTRERVSSFIGLGKDSAGEKFKEIIIKAVQDAKK